MFRRSQGLTFGGLDHGDAFRSIWWPGNNPLVVAVGHVDDVGIVDKDPDGTVEVLEAAAHGSLASHNGAGAVRRLPARDEVRHVRVLGAGAHVEDVAADAESRGVEQGPGGHWSARGGPIAGAQLLIPHDAAVAAAVHVNDKDVLRRVKGNIGHMGELALAQFAPALSWKSCRH